MPVLSLGAAPTSTTISLSFPAPLSGGAPTSYVVQYRITGQSTWTVYGTVTWVGWQTITGLAPGTSYDAEVFARNAGGNGLPSSPITIATLPLATALATLPGSVPWIAAGDVPTATTLSINFAAPYSGGIVTSYVIQYRATGQSAWATYGTVSWIGWQTLSGLLPGTSYDVRVYATNAAGSGQPSAVFTESTATK